MTCNVDDWTGALAVAMTCERARADIVFLVDSSRSICGSDASCSNWRSLLSFVNSIVNQLNIGNDNTRVGFVRYSSAGATTNPFYLNSHSSRSSLTSAVSGVPYVTDGSFFGDLTNAFRVARTQQFVSNRGDRVGAANIIILLMNGGVEYTAQAVSLLSFLRRTNVNLFCS